MCVFYVYLCAKFQVTVCSITKIANIFCNHVSVCFPAVWCHSSRFATYLPSHTADKEESRLNRGTLVFSESWQKKPSEVCPTRRTLMGHPGEPAGSRSQHFSPVSNNPLQIKLCAESRCKVSHRPVWEASLLAGRKQAETHSHV